MKIAVYCASTDGCSESIRQATRDLGTWIGENGHTLVYGAGNKGLMGIVADACLAAGGKVIGVLPDVPEIVSRRHPGLTQIIETGSMAERKQAMMDLADGCVALPGGPGTLDEVSDILCLDRLGLYQRPCVLFSPEGYWNGLKQMLETMKSAGFLREGELSNVTFAENTEELTTGLTWQKKQSSPPACL